ncbi:hypothetical protein J7L70_02925 [Candidatus Bathyarchaeota archaeon]|nr:hypothetical protein [Candidatus Bathyarchaeota archaeon]
MRYVTPSGRTLERTVNTTIDGLFGDSIVVSELGKWRVVASWIVDKDLTVASEERIFYVKTHGTVTLNASTNETFLGGKVNLTGSLSPVRAGKRVTVYYTIGDKKLNLTVAKTDNHGRFKFECTLNETGRVYFRVYVQEDDKCFEAWSRFEEVLVKRFVITKVNLEVKPENVYLGEGVILQGSIDPYIKGAKIFLKYMKNSGRWIDIATLTIGVNGSFKYSWIPDKPGLYVVTATYKGASIYTPSQNTTVLVVMHGPYELKMKVVDRNGRALSGAKFVLEGAETIETMLDKDGEVVINGLYPGPYKIVVYFKGVEAYNDVVEVYRDIDETISADVYSLKVLVKDPLNKPVQGIEVKLDLVSSHMMRGVTVSNVTDVYGYTYFTQVPRGSYLLSAEGQQVELTILENTGVTITVQNLNLQVILYMLTAVIVVETIVLIWLKAQERLKKAFRRERVE